MNAKFHNEISVKVKKTNLAFVNQIHRSACIQFKRHPLHHVNQEDTPQQNRRVERPGLLITSQSFSLKYRDLSSEERKHQI